jgi:hypothetical protein
MANILYVDRAFEVATVYCPDHLPKVTGPDISFHIFQEADALYQAAARIPEATISDVLLDGITCVQGEDELDGMTTHSPHDAGAIGNGISGPGDTPFCWTCAPVVRRAYGFALWWPLMVSRETAMSLAPADGFWVA